MNRRNPGQLFSVSGMAWLLLLLVLVLNFTVRWRLRELPLERDEGEYAYAGQLILQGVPPYKLAWNMKFPGVYIAYAGLMSVFGESPAGVHTGLICVTSLSILLVFLIGRELMGSAGALTAAALFTLLTALPEAFGLAGHATHFVVLFVCLGTFALLLAEKKKPWLWTLLSGAAFGAAILMKQQAFFFSAGRHGLAVVADLATQGKGRAAHRSFAGRRGLAVAADRRCNGLGRGLGPLQFLDH